MSLIHKKKIAVAVHKGGAGKTATASAIAAGLAKHGPCLLVDLDPQANATIGFGFAQHPDKPTLADFYEELLRQVGDGVLPEELRR